MLLRPPRLTGRRCVYMCAHVCVCVYVCLGLCVRMQGCAHMCVFCCVFVYVCACVREREGLREREKARENERERAATSTEAHRMQVCLSVYFFFLCPCVFVCVCVRVREGLRGGVCMCVVCACVVCVCVMLERARAALSTEAHRTHVHVCGCVRVFVLSACEVCVYM